MKIKLISDLWHWFHNLSLQLKNHNLVLAYNIRTANTSFGRNIYLGDNCRIFNSSLNDCTYAGDNAFINNSSIGKFCSIGPGVKMGMGQHPVDIFVSTSPYFYAPVDFKKFSFADKIYYNEHTRINVGSDVWIGANAMIMDGVSIGHGAVIAAGAVVTQDVPDYAIFGGIPARYIKSRFPEEVVQQLLKDSWWDKGEEWLKQHYKELHNVNSYLEKYGGKNN